MELFIFIFVPASLIILMAVSTFFFRRTTSQQHAARGDPLYTLPLNRFQIETRIKKYYDEESVYAGQYEMTMIDNITNIMVQNDTFTLCVEYQFIGQYNGRDRRVFVFQKRLGKWLIARMGENHSC